MKKKRTETSDDSDPTCVGDGCCELRAGGDVHPCDSEDTSKETVVRRVLSEREREGEGEREKSLPASEMGCWMLKSLVKGVVKIWGEDGIV